MATSEDDRASFHHHTKEQSLAMAQDSALQELNLQLIRAADEYDYTYVWTWMGLPIIQFPADIMATQEAIWTSRPDVIVELGVARGGSVCFLASILKSQGEGFVIGVDIDLRDHNRDSILRSPVADRIHLVDGSSTSTETYNVVRTMIPDGSKVMVILDSDHSRDHVLAECRLYSQLVTLGSYLVVADTVLGYMDAADAPTRRSQFLSQGNEPLAAAQQFLKESSDFAVDEPLNGKLLMSSSPRGYLKRVRDGRSLG